MTSKELVKKTIHFEMPDATPAQMPLLYFNENIEKSDIARVQYAVPSNFKPEDENLSEWGFVWERIDGTMGQPKNPPLTGWELYGDYQIPDAKAAGRFIHLPQFIENNKDKYIMAELGIQGLNFITFLRGFQETFEDFYLERAYIEDLSKKVFAFEEEIVRQFCSFDIDAIAFEDDLGTQQSLMLSPQLWREIYKPLYKTLFDVVHSYGKDVYLHSCGYVYDLIPDFIELGVDVLNFNQPDILGTENLGRDFGGKVCFSCPVDHQTVAISGTRQKIFDYVDTLQKNLGTYNGGLIGYVEEYSSVGMSDENYASICEAFEKKRNR